MRKRIEWLWEILDSNSASSTKRAKVIGGWVVHHHLYTCNNKRDGTHTSESMVFIADKDHEWHILKPIEEEKPKTTVKADDFASSNYN